MDRNWHDLTADLSALQHMILLLLYNASKMPLGLASLLSTLCNRAQFQAVGDMSILCSYFTIKITLSSMVLS